MNHLMVGIMDSRGWYTTVMINPFQLEKLKYPPKPTELINMLIDKHVREYRKQLKVDLLVEYEESLRCYNNKSFPVQDFNKAVEFLEERNKIIFEEVPNE